MYNSQFQPTQTIQIQNVNLKDLLHEFRGVVEMVFDEKLNKLTEANIPSGEKKLITSNELANWLGVSKITLWRYEKDGLLHPVKLGKNKLYNLDEVRELFANKEN